MSYLALPQYIKFTNGLHVPSNDYIQSLGDIKYGEIDLTASDGHSITLTRAPDGRLVIACLITPIHPLYQDIDLDESTLSELNQLNALWY